MNRRLWRELRVHWIYHQRIPIPHLNLGAAMWYLDIQKPDAFERLHTYSFISARLITLKASNKQKPALP